MGKFFESYMLPFSVTYLRGIQKTLSTLIDDTPIEETPLWAKRDFINKVFDSVNRVVESGKTVQPITPGLTVAHVKVLVATAILRAEEITTTQTSPWVYVGAGVGVMALYYLVRDRK